jgi:hypothetical protein
MSGLKRAIADLELRNAATMRGAQLAYDNLAPGDDFDDDWLTEDQALDQARDETLSATAWVADLLAKLTDTPPGWEPVDVFALCGSGDPLDAVAVETLAVHQLLAIVMIGADKPAMTALRELRERLARELRDDIHDRANELLAEQAREQQRQREGWEADRWLECAA